MNIGYFIDFKWNPPKGGGTVHAYQVARHLMDHGHKIHVLNNSYNLGPEVTHYRQREIVDFLRKIDVLYIRIQGSVGVERWTLLKALAFFSIPVVWEINSPLEELVTKGRKTAKEVRSLDRQRRMLAKLVDSGICVSKVMMDYAEQHLGIKNVHFVPNGSDPELFTPKKWDPGLYTGHEHFYKVLWSGSSDYGWQGIDIISEVARKVYAIDKDVKFFLVTRAKNLKSRKLFDKNLVVLDEMEYFKLPPYIASADVGLCLYHPYGWNGRFYFSPLKLFDYMASGLPVIASDVGQISEVLEHQKNGILTDNNTDKIAEGIVYLKNHRAESDKMAGQARADVERYYNWNRVGTDTEKILTTVFKKRQGV